jgi:hypothetical protein
MRLDQAQRRCLERRGRACRTFELAASSVIAARQGRGERKATQARDAASTRASKLSAGPRTPRKYPEPSSRS